MLKVEVKLRTVDDSVRNQGFYYLIEIKMMNQTTKVAEVYDIDLAREFADLVVGKFKGDATLSDTTEEKT